MTLLIWRRRQWESPPSKLSAEPGPLVMGRVQRQQVAAKWPGWPGDNVFRLIVTVAKVGSIIGRKGELVKKMCEETGVRIRIFECPLGISDRVVFSGIFTSNFLDWETRIYNQINSRENWCLCMGFARR